MAQARLINKKICVSEQVANLTPIGMLIYTWMIPHADDAGLLPSNIKTIRALVCPMLDISVEDFGIQLDSIVKENLIRLVTIESRDYYQVRNFYEYQTLKKDRQPQTLLKLDRSKSVKENWNQLESIGFQLESKWNPSGSNLEHNGFLNGTEWKGREEKRNDPKDKEEIGVQGEGKPKQATAEGPPPIIPPQEMSESTLKTNIEANQDYWKDRAVYYMVKLGIEPVELAKDKEELRLWYEHHRNLYRRDFDIQAITRWEEVTNTYRARIKDSKRPGFMRAFQALTKFNTPDPPPAAIDDS